ncbi:Mga helix-turn-helix domain-containing protein [Carnobacterium iners]|uniref:Mga helix-turn-helix domain-containing protein n=1 Tax=Carnobacterium iners TaxID=1073423 RepID=A0A1X7MXX6_9LACT|nr:helix-turn-helix domain-containing protein [Carnobacterium iners]SEK18681.1 Mga helix-turn-helix domain-containing protein [Carnobacterium iners]SMH29729.1 Mga helix-turn-helix domain-containing protein [Carnobacterium iners]
MRIEDFLEKREVFQMTILKKLILEGGKISYEKLRKELNITKASLANHLEEMKDYLEEYQGDCQVDSDGVFVELFLGNHFSIRTVYIDYVKRSLKYQLIDYIFKYQEFTIIKIISDFSISESSLFRKIKELNSLLKEFNIKIKNGQIYGEELQIRYFYFQVYWFLTTYEEYQEVLLTNQNQTLMNGFEKELDIKMNDLSRRRISLWFTISKKRASIPKKTYKNMVQKMKPYKNDYLNKQVRQLILLYFSRYSIEVEEEESMIHFIFLTTQSILSEKDFIDYDLVRSRRTPTALVDTLLRETILLYYLPTKPSIALERKVTFYLSQINGTLYFFEGALEMNDPKDFIAKESEVWGKNLETLSEQLLKTALETIDEKGSSVSSLQRLTLLDYSTVLAIADFNISKELLIGIDLDLMEIHAEIFTQTLMLNLKNVIGITVEKYRDHHTYDLVITTNLSSSFYTRATEIYIISEYFSKFDLNQIKFCINELKI